MVVVMIMPVMMNVCHYQQSFIFSMTFWSSCPSSPTLGVYLQILAKGDGWDMKKRIALDLHIAMFIFDIISCVQFTINHYIQGYYN